jgi:hypothetical protein
MARPTTFKKGQSGNPKGAPKKGHSMREAFLEYFSAQRPDEEKGVTRFLRVMQVLETNAIDKQDTVAAKYICDQVIGRAKETMDANLTGEVKITINKIVDE